MNRATVSFNQLPQDLRKLNEIGAFKVDLKNWRITSCENFRGKLFTMEKFYHYSGGSLSPAKNSSNTVPSSIE